MPKRNDINSVFVIGAGPIVIGQACEFDYSGTQACRALREEGIRVVLLNSNPATIMTDPAYADATYIEPINVQTAQAIIEKEKVDAVLPTMGGQTALNCAMELSKLGVFGKGRKKDGKPQLIGASADSIYKAEDREQFKVVIEKIGLKCAASAMVSDLREALEAQQDIGFPVIVRPSFTLGGSGGGIAYNRNEFNDLVGHGLVESPTGTVLIERSLIGWKEFEMEVVRDHRDNCIIICAIENVDPMGVHTGDSITVAPAQTLTDKEYQLMRDASIAILREIGVDTGGANVQFAINPQNGDMIVIEMNPRVSRSSALASKATGFPIAKVAAKLAVGYTLDEITNDITGGKTPASFEPSIDYIVTKIPRFDFEKFSPTPDILTTQMRSVGEVMAIGRTFPESLLKALYSLEANYNGDSKQTKTRHQLSEDMATPHSTRILDVFDALRFPFEVEEINKLTHIDNWFLHEMKTIVDAEGEMSRLKPEQLGKDKQRLRGWKQLGFSDAHIALMACGGKLTEDEVREVRVQCDVHPVYKRIDTCAGEFPTDTAYLYSTYEEECELRPTESKKKIVILGSGPNRIGQGVEFDYCCVHGVLALRDAGYETLMINCNPETVSTDYDTADRLFFEPLTVEHVWEIIRREKPFGVIVQFGGQTPLSLAHQLEQLGTPIIGTPVDAIDLAESRERFQRLLRANGLRQPNNRIVGLRGKSSDIEAAKKQALTAAEKIGYPLVVRPSYVLGGSKMEIIYDSETMTAYLEKNHAILSGDVLLDQFLEDAVEVDVDAVCDSKGGCFVAGVMEHIELAGVHSGDSSCSLPPHTLTDSLVKELKRQTKLLAKALGTVGLINVQYAIRGKTVYVLEANPRASRTVPFVSKAIGAPLAKIAAKVMVGISLVQQKADLPPPPTHFAVKEAVFPFNKFPDVDVLLGPEMKSTGESMGIAADFPSAFYLAQEAITPLPAGGGVALFSIYDEDKPQALRCAKQLRKLGYEVLATEKTARYFTENGVPTEKINKVKEGRPHIVDAIVDGRAQIVINTVGGGDFAGRADSFSIRRAALLGKVIYFTTIAGALALVEGLRRGASGRPTVRALQQWHKSKKGKSHANSNH